MKAESIAFVVAGMFFGVILGWVMATQQASRTDPDPPQAAAQPAAASTAQRQAPALDESRVQSLSAVLQREPNNAGAAVQLGNTYFDAERYEDAIQWYERALKIDPNNADASTDLGVSYYYTNRPDRALVQFERSLKIDPKHTKTMLNKGIVLAFGKQDLKGAAAEWKKVVELAPDTPEGQAARRALEGVADAHGAGAAAAPNNQ